MIDLFLRQLVGSGLVLALACASASAGEPVLVVPPAARPAPVRAPAAPVRSECDPEPTVQERAPTADGPQSSFLRAAQVLHLRVVASTPGDAFESSRCVALELEVVETFRGKGGARPGDRIRLVVKQSTITHWTDRPTERWWVIEHALAPDSELVAFCPADRRLADALRNACELHDAEIVGDLALVRDVESIDLDELLRRAHDHAASLSWVLPQVLWDRHEAAARDDVRVFAKIARLLEDPALSRIGRGALLLETYGRIGMAIPESSLPHVRRLALALFRLLGSSPAADVHDAVALPYLPNLLGISSGMPRRSSTEIFAGATGERARARAAVAAYRGPSNTAALAAWLAAK